MYPQQHPHQYHAPPYTTDLQQHQQQQSYYSQNPFQYSFPAATDSSLHPPGTDPHANSTAFSYDASSAYAAQPVDSQNWVVQQTEPVRYDLAVGSSYDTSAATASLPSNWNAAWSNQSFANDTTVILPNQTTVTNPLRCEVCKIDCNSEDAYKSHVSGKKHKKNVQLQSYPSSIQGQVLVGLVSNETESKTQLVLSGGASVDSGKLCSVCNIMCTSQDAYNKHLFGKKHKAQVSLMSSTGIGPYVAEFKRQGISPWQKAPKKIKVAQSAWCEVCKINCNSRDMYIVHLSGKKHLKNLEKFTNPKIEASTSVTAANTSQSATKPLIGPQEKPDTNKQPKPKKVPEVDIETKKRKVVEGGAAASSVKLCTLCNVVCNSQTVFNTHLVGQKHAAMVKKAGLTTRAVQKN